MALAYFITFSTYGTWLHGSGRGRGSVDRNHNAFGGTFVPPDSTRERAARDAMAGPVCTLDEPRRRVVRDAMAREKRWRLLAAHVRTNHVHVVVAADRDPARVMADLKARASRDLTRAGFDAADRRRWTRHGSTRHLFTTAEVAAKADYTLTGQGTPMASFDARQ